MLCGNTAYGITSVDELMDVPAQHWGKPALTTLVDKNIIEGHPNQTFQGDKPATRWQMVSALVGLLKGVEADLARLRSEKASAQDVEALCRVQKDLEAQIVALGKNQQTMDARLSVTELKDKEHDSRLSLLEKTQFHGDMTFGGLADMSSSGTGRGRDGIRDGISAIGRLRLSVDVPVIEDKPTSKLGTGRVQARMLGAFGRVSPLGYQEGNDGTTSYPFNLYSRISTDGSGFNEGLGTGSVGAQNGLAGNTLLLRPNIYLESAFYTQRFKSGIPLLTQFTKGPAAKGFETTGDLYTGVVRWWDLFDVSPYRGNELTQFQNNALINVPGNAVNIAQPMVAYVWHQGLGDSASLDVSTGVGTLDPGDVGNGLNLTYEARLNYRTSFLGPQFSKPGSLYAGGYHLWMVGNRRFTSFVSALSNRSLGLYPGVGDRGSGNAFYAGWNQEWWRGLGTHVSYLVNNNDPAIIGGTTLQPGPALVAAGARQAFNSVLNIPMSSVCQYFSKSKDVLGLGYAFVDIQEGGIRGSDYQDGFEHVLEGYYRWQINDSVSVIPSVQLIKNRLGIKNNGLTTLLGLRMNYSF
jgi:hypothetical protein